MLTRDTTLASPEKILSDNLTHKPSASQSVWDNFATGFATAPYAIKTMDSEFSKSPAGQSAAGIFEAVKRGNENPEVGWAQWGANEVSNMIGQGLNPISWALGGAGAVAMKPVTSLVSKLAPNALTALARVPLNKLLTEPFAKFIPETVGKEGQSLSLGLLGHEAAQGFGIGAGIGLPQETVNNFNAETGKHDILGIAKGLGMDGMFGMALSPIPVAYGILKGNINRARGLPSGFHVEHGEAEPHLSPQDHETWQAVDNHVQNAEGRAAGRDEATAAAERYLAKQGVSPNFEIMNKEQVDNFQAATVDHLLSDYIPDEQRTALTDFTVNAAIDDLSKNPEIFDGVRGYVDYADRNLEQKGDILAKANALVDQHLDMIKPGERLSMDQESLARIYHDHGEGNHLPMTVPKEVVKRVEQEKRIAALEEANQNLFEKYEQTGNSKHLEGMKVNNERIDALHDKLEPLKSADEELRALRKSIITDKGLNRNYERTPEFHRLQELADVWAPARTLLDRINLERGIREQEAYRDLAKTMLDIADGNLGKLADQSKVVDYLEARQAPQINEQKAGAVVEQVKKAQKVPSDAETMIAEQDRAVEDKGGKTEKQDYETAKDKFEEFKKSEGIFKNFISCVLGGQNG